MDGVPEASNPSLGSGRPKGTGICSDHGNRTRAIVLIGVVPLLLAACNPGIQNLGDWDPLRSSGTDASLAEIGNGADAIDTQDRSESGLDADERDEADVVDSGSLMDGECMVEITSISDGQVFKQGEPVLIHTRSSSPGGVMAQSRAYLDGVATGTSRLTPTVGSHVIKVEIELSDLEDGHYLGGCEDTVTIEVVN